LATSDILFIESLNPRPDWVFSETLFRVQFLQRTFEQTTINFATLDDGAGIILRALVGPFRKLSEHDRNEFLLDRIEADNRFSLLRREWKEHLSAADSLPHTQFSEVFLGGISRFFDEIRRDLRNESILRQLTGEFGTLPQGAERLEELFLLLEELRNFQGETRQFDAMGIWELLLNELLSLDSKRASELQRRLGRVLLDQPTELSPLEHEVWTALASKASLLVTVSQSTALHAETFGKHTNARSPISLVDCPPSERSRISVMRFVRNLEKVVSLSPEKPQRTGLVHAFLDSPAHKVAALGEGIRIWESSELREEVKRVAQVISESIANGLVSPDRVHVLALDLKLYGELLTEECRSRNVRVWISRGRRFVETPLGGLFVAFVNWLLSPSLQSLRMLILHPLWRVESDYWNELFALVGKLGLQTEDMHIEKWRVAIERYFSAKRDKFEESQALRTEFRRLLDVLENKVQLRSRLLDEKNLDTLQKSFRSTFHHCRKRLLAEPHGRTEETSFAVLALRRLRKLCKHAARKERFRFSTGPLLRTFCETILREAATEHCSVPRPENAVALTELLDIRAMKGGFNIVLGFNAEKFPAFRQEQSQDELLEVWRRARKRAGSETRVYEGLSLLSHLLTESDELILSYSRQTNLGEHLPVPFTVPFLSSDENVSEKIRVPGNAPFSSERVHLLKSRKSDQFTPFDGVIEKTELADRRGALRNSDAVEQVTHYSVSALEIFADCPQRFFFKHLLSLDDAPSAFLLEASAVLGNILHRSLERFFRLDFTDSTRFCSNFENACSRMASLAEEEFEKSELDWTAHPLLMDLKRKSLLGLTDSSDVQRGYLKAALVYQRDFLETFPQQVEFPFGREPSGARLVLESGEQKVSISGVIDRIDSLCGHSDELVESVWDYKTGMARSITDVDAGRSLQIPLYALAVKENIRPYVYPKRGGIISLSRPNRRDAEMRDPKRGVLIEHLATPKKGVPDAVSYRAERAREQVLRLDAQFRRGDFSQVPASKHCPWCNYNRICARDEQQLARKLAFREGRTLPTRESGREVLKIAQARPVEPSNKRKVELSGEQAAAVKARRNVVLRAGAGSGKTFVICSRLIELLLAGVESSSIVAITFTEKAADEISSRIERLLYEAVANEQWLGKALTIEELERLTAAQVRIGECYIGTIHAFAASLLRMDPLLSRVPDKSEMLLAGDRTELLERCAETVLNGSARAQTLDLLSAGLSYRSLRSALVHFAGRRDDLSSIRLQLSEPTRGRLLKFLAEEQQSRRKILSDRLLIFLESWRRETKEWMLSFALKDDQKEYFNALLHRTDELLRVMGAPPFDRADAKSCFSDLLELAESGKANAVRKTKNNPTNFSKVLRTYLEGIQTEWNLVFSDFEREVQVFQQLAQFSEILEQVHARFDEVKAATGLLDFDDLISRAHYVLCSEREGIFKERREKLFNRLRKKYRHFMVDEFQDTDSVQWAIVEKLYRLAEEISLAHEEEPDRLSASLFIVGDRQQSIYGFRGGDVRVFQSAEDELLRGGGSVLRLQDNYRSHPVLLDFANAFFAHLFELDWHLGTEPRVRTAVRFQELIAPRPVETREPRVFAVHQGPEGEDEDHSEAEGVAKLIQHICANPAKWPALQFDSEEPQIAILTRNAKELRLLARALEAEGIPFSMSHSSGFFDLEEIVQFENLLKVLLDARDRIALAGTLRSALGGMSDAELFACFEQVRGTTETTHPALNKFLEHLSRWRMAAQTLKPSLLLETIARELHLEAVYREAGDLEAYRNIERFIDAVRTAEESRGIGGSLPGALKWLTEQHSGGRLAPNGNRSDNLVVLNTIHGAKGLEYPMVIAPFLKPRKGRSFDFVMGELSGFSEELRILSMRVEDEDSHLREKTFLQHLLEESAANERRAEERRLFYVACTRAKEYLLFYLLENGAFREEQTNLRQMTPAERRDYAFASDLAFHWLTRILHLGEDGVAWRLGPNVELPILRIEELQ